MENFVLKSVGPFLRKSAGAFDPRMQPFFSTSQGRRPAPLSSRHQHTLQFAIYEQIGRYDGFLPRRQDAAFEV